MGGWVGATARHSLLDFFIIAAHLRIQLLQCGDHDITDIIQIFTRFFCFSVLLPIPLRLDNSDICDNMTMQSYNQWSPS